MNMRYQPSLQTARLRLRPFVADDAASVSTLAGAKSIAAATTSIPHPYSLTAAKTWIAGLPHLYRSGEAVHFALCLNETKELIGCLALNHIDRVNASAEMELWIGEPWQRQGFAREATKEMLNFAFHQLKLNRIFCCHLSKDPKSTQLLGNLGFQVEGTLRQAIYKWNRFEDLLVSARLKDDLP